MGLLLRLRVPTVIKKLFRRLAGVPQRAQGAPEAGCQLRYRLIGLHPINQRLFHKTG